MIPIELDALVHLEQIRQVQAQYLRFVDTKQWAEFRALFTDDATFEGQWAVAPGPDEFVDRVRRNLADIDSVHYGFMPEVRMLDSSRARAVMAVFDYLRWPRGSRRYLDAGPDDQCGIRGYGHYENAYRRTTDGWRVSHLRLTRLRIEVLVDDVVTLDEGWIPSGATNWLDGST